MRPDHDCARAASAITGNACPVCDRRRFTDRISALEAENARLLDECRAWRRQVAEYYLGEFARHATPGECRAEAVRRCLDADAEIEARAEVESLRKALRARGIHTWDCRAYNVVGRTGSHVGHVGMLWSDGDERSCNCVLGAALAPRGGE